MYFVCRLKKMNTIKQLTTDLAVATKKKADADAAIATAEKQKADEEKRRADVVLFEFPGANGHVARCRIPTAAVIHYGLFRILLSSSGATVRNIVQTFTQQTVSRVNRSSSIVEGGMGSKMEFFFIWNMY